MVNEETADESQYVSQYVHTNFALSYILYLQMKDKPWLFNMGAPPLCTIDIALHHGITTSPLTRGLGLGWPQAQVLACSVADGLLHLVHKKLVSTLVGADDQPSLPSKHHCSISRIFEVRRGIDSKLSSSEILIVVKPD